MAGASYGGGMPDFSLDPTFGSVDLQSGFEPDPYNIELTSGGGIDAEVVGCAGMIATAPDFRLNYAASDVLPLIISTMSSDDTTLVINQPDGSWICDDDSGENFNASVTMEAPMTGQYDIWVGSFFGDNQPATLSISELYSN
ncbi:MAG TPA: peptidase S1 [Hyphomonadaceae bacterium]|nr:peptidase S1 [Ponticaulis sp.]HBH91284.1 peptidase S1 [Hyphomonadaceae bacterium]HBJ91773.1 peptidase S1 [Hyphomonadaceae bacterium]